MCIAKFLFNIENPGQIGNLFDTKPMFHCVCMCSCVHIGYGGDEGVVHTLCFLTNSER